MASALFRIGPFVALSLAVCLSVGQATAEGQRQQQHAAHEHGVARLNLAWEGAEVYIELESPAVNILGFEHAPVSNADHAAVKKAVVALGDAAELFRFSVEAQCRLVEAGVDGLGMEAHHSEAAPGHRHAASAEHGERQGDDHGQGHADIDAGYRFACSRPQQLRRLDVLLFDAFPSIRHLQVQFITADRQGAVELDAANRTLTF